MTRERVKRCVGDRGAMLVEAAFVFPIFLTLLFGIVDIGNAEFQTSQATAAARDGARVGILHFDSADVSSSSDNQIIVAQVNARLAGQTATVSVSCLDGLTGTTALTCALAVPDQDRIQVTVSWAYNALTPVMATMGAKTITGSATMAILGEPTGLPATTTTTTTTTTGPGATTTSSTTSTTSTTAPAGSCSIVGLSVSPALPLVRQNKNSTSLRSDTTFTVTTNNAAPCTGLKIQFPTRTAPTTWSLTPAGGATWTAVVHKADLAWAAGTNLPLYVQSSTGTTLTGGTFSVTVT
jgi:Flp pilus assembly protein TadG